MDHHPLQNKNRDQVKKGAVSGWLPRFVLCSIATWALAALALFCLGWPGHARAQPYPSRAVHIVVPFPAGGGIDVLVRAVCAELSTRWGQPVIVDNKSGAGSLIGAEAVARAAPDGYTLMATVNQTFTANRFLYKSLPYDPDRSFLPITLMVQSDHFILAKAALPAKNLRELVTLARAEQSGLNYGDRKSVV